MSVWVLRARLRHDGDELTPALTGHVIVDGIEGHTARVERPDGSRVDWDLTNLPRGVKEGDAVKLSVEHGDLEIEIDETETRRRREEAQAQLDELNGRSPGPGNA